MTRARTVGCRVKDLVLNMEIFSMLSTPLMTSGGKPGESPWRETVRRWGSSPANGGKNVFSIQSICFSAIQGVETKKDKDVANCSQNIYFSGMVSPQGNCQWWQATWIKYSHSPYIGVLPGLVSVIRHKGRKRICLYCLPETFTSIHMYKTMTIILYADLQTQRTYFKGLKFTR